MSSQPPSDLPSGQQSEPPSGPPSGPLSGPSSNPPPSGQSPRPGSGSGQGTPPDPGPPTEISGPPSQPPGDRRLSAASSGGPRRPWWRSVRGIALVAAVAAVAAVLAVVLTNRSQKAQAAQNVALQSVGSSGPAPFTSTVATTETASATPPAANSTAAATATAGTRSYQGSAVGLYGGTERLSSCDVAQLSAFLTAHPDKARAWAGVEGIEPSAVPSYLRTLTPVVLRLDTRVTNHGFSNGAATSFQSVLQGGTAVLIDAHGLPRVRCACGNPLLAPLADDASTRFTGTRWTSFEPGNTVVVVPSEVEVTVIVLVDPATGQWFGRPTGSHGDTDHRMPPPSTSPVPSVSTSASGSASTSGSASSSASSSPSPSPSPSGSTSEAPSSSLPPAPSDTTSTAPTTPTTSTSSASAPPPVETLRPSSASLSGVSASVEGA